jgi:hypothetical protein
MDTAVEFHPRNGATVVTADLIAGVAVKFHPENIEIANDVYGSAVSIFERVVTTAALTNALVVEGPTDSVIVVLNTLVIKLVS